MPYIKPERRDDLEFGNRDRPKTAGELNYRLTVECFEYLQARGKTYAILNDIIGALECAKQEFYRRIASPYEDTKIAENGDVYD